MSRKWILFGSLLAAATLAVVGCGKTQPSEKPAGPQPGGAPKDKGGEHRDKGGEHKDHKDGDPKDKGGDHGHKPGAHGGTLVSLGKDSYHAEVVFEKEGVIRLYTLGKDESKTHEIEIQELVGHVTAAGATDAVQVKFVAEPPKGAAAGKTSVFVGKLPPELHGKKVKVVINNIQVGTERFRIEFANEKDAKGGHDH